MCCCLRVFNNGSLSLPFISLQSAWWRGIQRPNIDIDQTIIFIKLQNSKKLMKFHDDEITRKGLRRQRSTDCLSHPFHQILSTRCDINKQVRQTGSATETSHAFSPSHHDSCLPTVLYVPCQHFYFLIFISTRFSSSSYSDFSFSHVIRHHWGERTLWYIKVFWKSSEHKLPCWQEFAVLFVYSWHLQTSIMSVFLCMCAVMLCSLCTLHIVCILLICMRWIFW